MPAWERNLRTHMALSVLAVKTRSTHSLQAFESAHFTATLLADDDQVPEDARIALMGIHDISVQTVQSDTQSYTNTVQGLQNTQPVQSHWEQTINDADDAAIRNFADRIHAAGTQAISYINTMPPSQQSGAAGLYGQGMSIVNSVINQVSGALGKVIDSIKDFLSGIWDSIQKTWNSVKSWCSTAVSSIASVFGLFSATLTVPGVAAATGDVSGYTGSIGWSIDNGESATRSTFEGITLRVSENMGVVSTQFGIEDVPNRGKCFVGRIAFGPKFATPQGKSVTVTDLQNYWRNMVGSARGPDPLPDFEARTDMSNGNGANDYGVQDHGMIGNGMMGNGMNGNGYYTPGVGKKGTIGRKFTVRPGILGNNSFDMSAA